MTAGEAGRAVRTASPREGGMARVKTEKPAKEAARGRRFPLLMSDADRAAIAYLQGKYLFGTMANAIRYALREQAKDVPRSEAWGRRAHRIRESVVDMLSKSRQDEQEPGTKQTSLWINDAENAHVEAVMDRHGLRARSEAVRFAVRMQSDSEGFAPPSGNW